MGAVATGGVPPPQDGGEVPITSSPRPQGAVLALPHVAASVVADAHPRQVLIRVASVQRHGGLADVGGGGELVGVDDGVAVRWGY